MSNKIGDLLIGTGVDLSGLKGGIDEAVNVVTGGGKKLADAAKDAGNKVGDGMGKSSKGVETLRKQMRAASNDAQKLAQQFGLDSKEFLEAARTAGSFKNELADVQEVIQAFSSDAPTFNAIGGALKGLAGSARAVTGAMALLGDAGKDTQEMLLKVQASIAFAEGLESISSLKDNFAALSVVVMANPLVAGVAAAAIIAGAAAWVIYNNSITEAERHQQMINDLQNESAKTVVDEQVRMQQLLAIAQDDNQAKATRLKAIDDLNKISPQYLGNLNLENINTQAATQATAQYIQQLQKKALVQAAEKKITEEATRLLEMQQKTGASVGDVWAYIKGQIAGTGGVMGVAENNLSKIAEVQGNIAALGKVISDNSAAYVDMAGGDAGGKQVEAINQRITALQRYIDLLRAQGVNEYELELLSQRKAQMEIADLQKEYAGLQARNAAQNEQVAVLEKIRDLQNQIAISNAKISGMKYEQVYGSGGPNIAAPDVNQSTLPELKLDTKPLEEQNKQLQQMGQHLAYANQQTPQMAIGWADVNNSLKLAIPLNDLAAQGIGFLAQQIGGAMAGAQVSMASILNGLIGMLGNFMQSLGESMIAAGTAGISAQALFEQPELAIAAGVALVALSAVVSQLLKAGPAGGGSSGGGSGPRTLGSGQIKLAKGGMAYGPTLATVGDNPGARFNPEYIGPVSDLQKFFGSGSGQPVALTGWLRGGDIGLTQNVSAKKLGREGARVR